MLNGNKCYMLHGTKYYMALYVTTCYMVLHITWLVLHVKWYFMLLCYVVLHVMIHMVLHVMMLHGSEFDSLIHIQSVEYMLFRLWN